MFPYKEGESTAFSEALLGQLDTTSKYYDKWKNDINALDKHRNLIIHPETNSNFIQSLLKYYTQLMTVSVKFELNINWPWYNAFGKDKKLVLGSCVAYERAAVLFNLAILYANLGMECLDKGDADGLKTATHLFAQSVGVITFLEIKVKEDGLGAKGRSQLKALGALMLGMGQECFVLKVKFIWLIIGNKGEIKGLNHFEISVFSC